MKTVHHDKFVPANRPPQPSAGHQSQLGSPHDAIHSVWRRMRGGLFQVPESICTHVAADSAEAWEVYDMDAAGCTICGAMHKCNHEVERCEIVENEEGQLICAVTGLCKRMLVFASTEFTDNNCLPDDAPFDRPRVDKDVQPPASRNTHQPAQSRDPCPVLACARHPAGKTKMSPSFIRKKKRFSMTTGLVPPQGWLHGSCATVTTRSGGDLHATVAVCINEIICSSTWERSMMTENGRMEGRIRSTLSKVRPTLSPACPPTPPLPDTRLFVCV